jgi:transposase
MAGDELLAQWLHVKYAAPERRTLCPVCGYQLEETERGLHCQTCGWKENISIRFIPRTPETPQS